ncbi:MAG: GSU2403 family nucleotidyltransferase fold protein [Atopobiaceae bacterium]
MTPKQADAFERLLHMLDEHDWLQYFMVVGSWAEFLYSEASVLDDFQPYLRTMDIDLLVRNLRKPSQKVSVISVARDEGYVVDSDYIDGVTKLYDDTGLEVEFLIGQMGSGVYSALQTNVGVTAQALRHMDVMLRHPTIAAWRGMDVVVPLPEAYAAHKMVINSRRKEKARKDEAAMAELWPYLDIQKFHEVVGEMSKRERATVEEYLDSHDMR